MPNDTQEVTLYEILQVLTLIHSELVVIKDSLTANDTERQKYIQSTLNRKA